MTPSDAGRETRPGSVPLTPDPARLAERLAHCLAQPLPGLAAQCLMAPVGRITSDYDANPPGARAAGVLLLLTPALELVYIRRVEDGGRHSGQIAFPGGIREAHDADLVATALRETEEEIGVPRDSVTVLGALTPLYVPVTNFRIQPVVGVVDASPRFVCQPSEVDEVILLPVAGFPASLGEFEYSRDGAPHRAPCYRFGAVEVWGATAMITAEFLAVWAKALLRSGSSADRGG